MVIVALLLYLIFQTKGKTNFKYEKRVLPLTIFTVALTLLQIFLGTQVRQFIDDQIELVGYTGKGLWLQEPEIQFYIHRSLSILVLVLNGALFWTIIKNKLGFEKIKWVMALIGLEILTGILMFYFDFPFASQPLHLILASILFGVQFYLFLEVFKSRKSLKSS